jgi:opacity protein-like surface antigen
MSDNGPVTRDDTEAAKKLVTAKQEGPHDKEMSTMRRVIAFLFVVALLAAAPAQAQDKKANVNIGGGYTFSLSEVRKYLGDGYNINVGVTFNVMPVLGLQVEYSYNGLGKKQVQLPAVTPPAGAVQKPIYGDMNMQYGDLNLVYKPRTSGKAKPYLIAGGGVYYRPVKVTTPGAGYVPPYCNPWYYICWPGGLVEVDYVLAEASTWATGLDFGGGVTVMATDTFGIYFEARYHYIWGPEIKDLQGNSLGKATGQFLPITFGIRF